MSLSEKIIRPELRELSAYHVPDAAGLLKLDAMENPYRLPPELAAELATRLADVALNRYPTPTYTGLKQRIRDHLGVPAGFDVLLGNGSDELISMISIACARPGAKVLAPTPGFVMYAMSAKFAGIEFVGVPLLTDFTLDLAAMLDAIRVHQPSAVWLAYPNNPTGNLFDDDQIVAILKAMAGVGVVVVDEAYQPFAQASFMERLPEFDNLIVMRTVSKLGLAGIRLGYMAASAELLTEFDKVRPPYNINVLTEAAAEFLLDRIDVLDAQAAELRQQRGQLMSALAGLAGVTVYPSAANFLLLRVADADRVFAQLLQRRVLVKNVGRMHALLENCLRVTVGTPEENQQFLDALSASIAS